MSSDLKLEAETGRTLGSRSSRSLRRSDKIPAIVYGQGSDPLPVTLDRPKFRAALNAAGPNAVITLDVDGSDYLTIVKNMQRDPIANRVTHVDFMLIDLDQRLVVDVPISLVGEAALVVQEGAVVQQQMMTLTVEAPAGNIPQLFEVDISEMSIDNPVRVSVIEMGSGVIAQVEDDALIAIGQRSRAAVAAEEVED
ncbi:MAG: 50S ribosomal protein L25, partial [Actinomycetota bacterium]|nr:50S ribosomal protein L25 [Actinomycetota bacterium]